MKTTTEINRDVLRALRVDLDTALAAIGKKHGLAITSGNASFTPGRFTMKLEGYIAGGQSPGEQRLAAVGSLYGIDPAWVGKSVLFNGKRFTLEGMKSGGRSVIIVREPDGKRFRANVEQFAQSARLV